MKVMVLSIAYNGRHEIPRRLELFHALVVLLSNKELLTVVIDQQQNQRETP